jgi:hypothetical protein
MVPGTFFTGSSYRLRSFEIYINDPDVIQELRLAVYRGGFGPNDPQGATLVEDLFLTNSGSAVNQWWTVNSAIKPVFNSGEQIWLCFKGNDEAFTILYDTVAANRGNLSSAGACDIGSLYDPNEFVDWPGTIFDTFTPSGRFYNVRINVDQHVDCNAVLTFNVASASAGTAVGSCAATLSFANTSLLSGAALTRCNSSIIFGVDASGITQAVASCAAAFRFASTVTVAGAPSPCWSGAACAKHPFSATARTTAVYNEV